MSAVLFLAQWYESAQWSNWALVLIGAITAYAVWIQAKETAKATGAMRDSTHHQETAERAWLTATVENFQPGGTLIHIAIPIKNSGRTAAKVKRTLVTGKLLPFPENSLGKPASLPETPLYDQTTNAVLTEGKDFIIPPGGIHRAYVAIWADDYTKMLERKLSLYVYGVVTYLDTIRGEEHKTCFCEMYWVPQQGANPSEREGFMFSPNMIPPSYICAT